MVQLFNNGNALLRTATVASGAASFAVQLASSGQTRALDPVPEHGGVHRSEHAIDRHGELSRARRRRAPSRSRRSRRRIPR